MRTKQRQIVGSATIRRNILTMLKPLKKEALMLNLVMKNYLGSSFLFCNFLLLSLIFKLFIMYIAIGNIIWVSFCVVMTYASYKTGE